MISPPEKGNVIISTKNNNKLNFTAPQGANFDQIFHRQKDADFFHTVGIKRHVS